VAKAARERLSDRTRIVRAVESAVLVPVKSFGAAKRRLTGWLSDDDRRRLARWMAERVIAAAAPQPVFVACDDELVADWAEALGAHVLWGPGLGLNGAIDHGIDTMAGKGIDHVTVAHGDLPLADGLAQIAVEGHVVLIADRRRDGTNVLSRPTSIALPAEYGGGSFRRHLAAGLASGSPVAVRRDPRLSIDVDTVDDCRHPLVAPVLAALGMTIHDR
jgi:2-phospho-L-lactate guanylyltransferase